MTTQDVTADTNGLTEEQAVALQRWQGSLLVLGGPGTGKTTLVARAAAGRLAEGFRPLVLAPGRQAASALRNRIARGSAAPPSWRSPRSMPWPAPWSTSTPTRRTGGC